jgi:DNA polymerase family A
VRDALLDRLRLQPAWLELYYGHYLPLQSAIIEAERVGFYIDRGRAERVNVRLSKACERLIDELRDLADDPAFNVRSLPTLQALLFDRWGLPQVEGRSTKEGVLQTLLGDALLGQDHRRFIKTLLEYRGVDKLRGTYCQGILDKLSPDGRLRPNWNIAGTVTGRFSCEAPAINTLPHEGTRAPLTVSNGGRPMPHAPATRPRASASVLTSSSTRAPPTGGPAAVCVAGAPRCACRASVRGDPRHGRRAALDTHTGRYVWHAAGLEPRSGVGCS